MYSSFLGGSGHRSSDVESDLFGIQVALEGATPLAGALSLIGRASAGIYHVRGDGRFNSRLTPFKISLPSTETCKSLIFSVSVMNFGTRKNCEAR